MKIALIGAGAQAKYAAEIFSLTGSEVVVVNLEPDGTVTWPEAYGHTVVASDDELGGLADSGATHGIVCVADPRRKRNLWNIMRERIGLQPVSAIHPQAIVASTASVGPGCIVNAGAVVQPFASLGTGCMLHAGAVVEHDGRVGDFVVIGPRAALAGWVTVGDGAIIYTGATILPQVTVGAEAVVGAGAVALDDVAPGTTVAGVPARSTMSKKR